MDTQKIRVLIIKNGVSDHVPHEELINLLVSFPVVFYQLSDNEWFVYFSVGMAKNEISNFCSKAKIKYNLNKTKGYFEGIYAGKIKTIKKCLNRHNVDYKFYQKPETKGLKMEPSSDVVRPASSSLVFKNTGIADILKSEEIETASDEPQSNSPHVLEGATFFHPDLELARRVLEESFQERCGDIQIKNIVIDITD